MHNAHCTLNNNMVRELHKAVWLPSMVQNGSEDGGVDERVGLQYQLVGRTTPLTQGKWVLTPSREITGYHKNWE